jgi:tetratricopeptide (TPR) repeat protein
LRSTFQARESKLWVKAALLAAAFTAWFWFSAAPPGLAQNDGQATASDPLKQHYSAAAAFLSRGDQQDAASEYQAFLAEALHRAANANAQIGEAQRATELFTQALELDQRNATLLDDFAALRFDHDQLPEAESLLNAALALNADDVRAHFLLGRVLFTQERYLAAQPHLELAWSHGRAQADPNAPDAWYVLGITDLKLQQLASAQEVFRKALLLLGDKASTHARLGRAYYAGDYPDEAIRECKKAIALDPKALGQHYSLGLAYLGHNPEAGFARAEPEFRAELALAPSDFGSHYMLGYIALKQSRMPEAETEITRALALKPDDPSALLLAGELFSATARDPQAEPLLRQAISALGTSSPPKYDAIRAHYMLGRLLQRTGRGDEAAQELALSDELRKQFREASGSAPKDKTAASPQNQQPEDLPRPATAAERAQAAAFLHELGPAIALAFNNLGAIAANQHQCPACVTYFQRAGEWDPSQEGLDRNLGKAAFLCKHYEQAVPPLSRYLEQHSDDVGVRSALGLSLFHLGQYEKVVAVLGPIQASIQSNPELAEAYATSVSKSEKK